MEVEDTRQGNILSQFALNLQYNITLSSLALLMLFSATLSLLATMLTLTISATVNAKRQPLFKTNINGLDF